MAKSVTKSFKKTQRWRLEPYSGRNSRHTCPSCGVKHVFSRFIDVTTGEYFADDVGWCNRSERCGYTKSVPDVNGNEQYVPTKVVKESYLKDDITHLIDAKQVMRSMVEADNNFLRYLFTHFPHKEVRDVIDLYKIGSSDLWEASTVFWQIDQDWNVRTGKIMQYDSKTLKRVKEPYNKISWVHSPDKELEGSADFCLTQCFFGEHLLSLDKYDTFGLVESEKTAILCALMNPKIGWIASGGLMNINETRMLPFKDKRIIAYPDKGKALHTWEERLAPFVGDYDVTISKSVENNTALAEGDDLGDLILMKHVKDGN